MKKLKKNNLDFEKAYAYVVENIGELNSLGDALIEEVDFRKGVFYTLLPDDADLERIYEFSYGNMIPQVPLEKKYYHVSGVGYVPGVDVISIDEDVAKFIFDFLSEGAKNLVIFDHNAARPSDPHLNIEGAKTLIRGSEEVYQLINTVADKDSILKVHRKTSEAWHSLSVLCRDLNIASSTLTDEILKSVCRHLQYIIVGAYDGEGYVFWQKK